MDDEDSFDAAFRATRVESLMIPPLQPPPTTDSLRYLRRPRKSIQDDLQDGS